MTKYFLWKAGNNQAAIYSYDPKKVRTDPGCSPPWIKCHLVMGTRGLTFLIEWAINVDGQNRLSISEESFPFYQLKFDLVKPNIDGNCR